MAKIEVVKDSPSPTALQPKLENNPKVTWSQRRVTVLAAVLACLLSSRSATAQLSKHEDLNAELTSAPSVIYRFPGGRLLKQVFYRGPNHHLWLSTWPDASGRWWDAGTDLGGEELTTGPSAVVRDHDRVDVYYGGPNHHLWVSNWPDASGHSWGKPVDLGGVELRSDPSAVVRREGKIDVYYRGPNDHLWASSWPDASGHWWGAPVDLQGVKLTTGPRAVIHGDGYLVDVFFAGPNRTLMYMYKDYGFGGSAWSPQYDTYVRTSATPGTSFMDDQNLNVFVKGPDNHLEFGLFPMSYPAAMLSQGAYLGGDLASGPSAMESVLSNKRFYGHEVFYQGTNGHLWVFELPRPADLIGESRDGNGLLVNPHFASEIMGPNFSNPSVICERQVWLPPCTVQATHMNSDPNPFCLAGAGGRPPGHANWTQPVTYEGRIWWQDQNQWANDHDISLGLHFSNFGDYDRVIEFSPEETIYQFKTGFWDFFHKEIDKGSAQNLINGHWAMVIGVLGIDIEHGYNVPVELHPAFGIGLHVNQDPGIPVRAGELASDPNDDVWAFFARNWGSEGFCGPATETVNLKQLQFRIPWRFRASAVTVKSRNFFWRNAGSFSVSVEPRPMENAVLVTVPVGEIFPPGQTQIPPWLSDGGGGNRAYGEVHLSWSFNATSPLRTEVESTPGTEEKLAEALKNLSAEDRAALDALQPKSFQGDTVPEAPGPAAQQDSSLPSTPAVVKVVNDPEGVKRQEKLLQLLRKLLGPDWRF